MAWQRLNLNLPPELQTIAQGVVTGIDAVKSALQLVVTQARAAQVLTQDTEGAAVQATNAAIQAAVQAVTTLVNELLDTSGVYLLQIPIPKKGLVNVISSPNTSDEPGSNFVGFPEGNILGALGLDEASVVRDAPSFAKIFEPGGLFLGGNAYLVKAIAEALYDPKDSNRPKFGTSSFWAYSLMLAGGSDLTSVLGVASLFEKLFTPASSANTVGASRGVADVVPRGLNVKPSGRGYFPVLSWEPVAPSIRLSGFDDARVVPTHYAIIRSTDFRAKTAAKVLDLFATTELTKDLSGQFGAKVLYVAPFDGVVNRYVDETELAVDTTYYYHVAYRTRTDADPSQGTSQPAPTQNKRQGQPISNEMPSVENPFSRLSSCAEYRRPKSASQLTASGLGKAPDWQRTPSAATLVPGAEKFLDRALEKLATLGQASQTLTSTNEAYLDFLQREVDKLQREVGELQLFLGQLTNIFSTLQSGIYATLREGKGGVSNFLSDLIRTLDDNTDENRPAFDTGDEYVTGTVLLCVGPDPAPIAAAFALFTALFGPPADSEALAGINSISAGLTTVEQALIDEIQTPSVAFGTDMLPRPPGQGDASCS